MNMHPAAKAPPSAADNKSFQPEKKAMTMQSLSTTTTELKPVELQSYLDEGWRIFVDTCSFMSSGCEPFFTRSAAAFRDAGVSIHCPKEVRRELEKNLSSPKEQTRQLAMRGLSAYDALDKLDVLREIDCPGSQENVFADPVFAKIFDEQRAEHKLLLITQDRRLAAGLYSRNQDEFMHFHPVHVLRLLSRGDLGFLNHPQTQELMFPPNMNDFSRQSVPMIRAHLVSSEAVPPAGRSVPRTVSAGRTGDVREASRPEKESVSKVVSKPAVPAVEKAAPALHAAFPVCTSVIDLEDRPVGIDRAPVEGDVVCDEFGMTHTLGRRLGEGGEGIVYDAGNGMVAKIYHADKCTTRRAILSGTISFTTRSFGAMQFLEYMLRSGRLQPVSCRKYAGALYGTLSRMAEMPLSEIESAHEFEQIAEGLRQLDAFSQLNKTSNHMYSSALN